MALSSAEYLSMASALRLAELKTRMSSKAKSKTLNQKGLVKWFTKTPQSMKACSKGVVKMVLAECFIQTEINT